MTEKQFSYQMRALHLEMFYSLSVSSFIVKLLMFILRWGVPSEISIGSEGSLGRAECERQNLIQNRFNDKSSNKIF